MSLKRKFAYNSTNTAPNFDYYYKQQQQQQQQQHMGSKQSTTAANYNIPKRKRSNTHASHHSTHLDTKTVQEPTRPKIIPAPAQVIM
jgi:hypothetical protein